MTDPLREIREALTRLGHHDGDALSGGCPACLAQLDIERRGADWLRTLLSRVEALTDHLDLMTDEFLRIKGLTVNGFLSPSSAGEVAGLCDRALAVTKQRVPIIVQRDEAVARVDTLEVEKQQADAWWREQRDGWAAQMRELEAERDDLTHRLDKLEQAVTMTLNLVAYIRGERDRLKAEIDQWIEREAAVCPEDVGFVELIGVLRKNVAQLRADLQTAVTVCSRSGDELVQARADLAASEAKWEKLVDFTRWLVAEDGTRSALLAAKMSDLDAGAEKEHA